VAIVMFQPNRIAAVESPPLEALLKLHTDGNHKEAYDGLRSFVLERKDAASAELVKAFETAINCLQQLNRTDEIDAFREKAIEVHKDDWRLLAAVARSYQSIDHSGYMIAGEFHRGRHRGGGK